MNNVSLKSLFLFDSMLTPKIITVVYWLVLLGAVIAGIRLMAMPYYGGVFKGLALIVGVAVVGRIWCELLIVLFKIHENIRKIAGNEPPAQTATESGISTEEPTRPAM